MAIEVASKQHVIGGAAECLRIFENGEDIGEIRARRAVSADDEER